MKKLLIISIFLLVGNHSFAQHFEIHNGDTINYMDQDSLKQGLWMLTSYDNDGIPQYNLNIHYLDGKIDGLWEQSYVDGRLREKRIYHQNTIAESTIIEWYDYKMMKSKTSFIYIDSKKLNHGEWVNYYENGKPQIKSHYNKGQSDGEWIGYNEKGKIKYKMIYENGAYKSYVEYDENGQEKK